MPSKRSEHRKELWALALIGALTALFAWPRLRYPSFIAEDALVFFKQARDFGFASLWHPYAGYLHTIQRITALVAYPLDVRFQPTAYVIASVILTWLAASFLYKALRSSHSVLAGLTAAGLLLLSPSRSEISYMLTNVQWIFAAVLLVSFAELRVPLLGSRWLTITILLLVGLTGPFSALFIIPLAIRWYWLRDHRVCWYIYAPVIIAATVQVFFFLDSPRQSYGINAWAGIVTFLKAILVDHPMRWFGPSVPSALSFLVFWMSVTLIALEALREVTERPKRSPPRTLVYAIGGLAAYAAGLYSYRFDPTLISPNATLYAGGYLGERYFYVPTVAFGLATVSPLVSRNRLRSGAAFLVIACLMISGATMIWKLAHEDLEWTAYVKLADREPNVQIPIYSGLLLDTLAHKSPIVQTFPITSLPMKTNDALVKRDTSGYEIIATGNDPQLIAEIPPACRDQRYVALRIDGLESKAIQAFFALDTPTFSERHSITLANIDGRVMYFAFAKAAGHDAFLRLDPATAGGRYAATDIDVLCY